MYFIKPTTITTAMLIGSTIEEADYDEWEEGTSYSPGAQVMVAAEHKCLECLSAATGGLTADLLDEDCADTTGWTDSSMGGTVTVSPSGQYKFQSLTTMWNYGMLSRTLTTPPNTLTIELNTYFDKLGAYADTNYFALYYGNATWRFRARFCSDGLFIDKAGGAVGEVGTNIVKCNSTAAWQNWRFEIDKTTESSATVAVYSKEADADWVSQGTVDCDWESASTDGQFYVAQYTGAAGGTNYIAHVSYIKVATGTGVISSTTDSPVGNEDWTEIGATNRWKCFDNAIGEQTSGGSATKYVLEPGAIDSVALLNIESTSIGIYLIDKSDNLITNGEDWTGATGTTPPTGWTKTGTPADLAIDSGMIKITADATDEGIYQDITVTPGGVYQLIGLYKNNSGKHASYQIYDVTNAAVITATTLLTSRTYMACFTSRFTAPAGCTSVRIKLLASEADAIAYFDYVKCAPEEYYYALTTGSSVTDVVRSDVDSIATGILIFIVNYTAGTAKIGEFIVGTKTTLGSMRYSPSIGITDYSTKEVDAYGKYTIVERSYAKRMSCSLIILNTAVDEVIRLLYLYRATPLVWVGDPSYNSLIVYGYYKDFQVVFSRPLSCDCSLEIEGLT
jgi:hypothetical protein